MFHVPLLHLEHMPLQRFLQGPASNILNRNSKTIKNIKCDKILNYCLTTASRKKVITRLCRFLKLNRHSSVWYLCKIPFELRTRWMCFLCQPLEDGRHLISILIKKKKKHLQLTDCSSLWRSCWNHAGKNKNKQKAHKTGLDSCSLGLYLWLLQDLI